MDKKERLYDAMGELLYVIALADGVIQEEETNELEKIVNLHPKGAAIRWSFNYEKNRNADPEEVYDKVLSACHSYGPSPIYNEFIQAMHQIADAAAGIEEAESEKIQAFSDDLIARFQKDIERLK
jgi:tellurite resistance protein